MSTCIVVDADDWAGADCVSVGDTGFGVLASSVPSSGTNGGGYMYADLVLPADAGKEVCGRITVWPLYGTLDAGEDTGFTYTRTGDGADSFQYQPYFDGVAVGSPRTVSLSVGAGFATGALLTGTSSFIGGGATGNVSLSATAPGATLVGISSFTGGAAIGNISISATAPGAALVGTSSIIAGQAYALGSDPAPDNRTFMVDRDNRVFTVR